MEELRKSVIILLTDLFLITSKKLNLSYDCRYFAKLLESELYSSLQKYDYIVTVVDLSTQLMINNGPFPDDILAIKYMNKEITTDQIISATQVFLLPREKIIKMFTELLYKYSTDKNHITCIVNKIERSCYNAVIKSSKESEDPPCRHWQFPVFVEMYSNRCASIYNILNPNSRTCKTYGSYLLDKVLSEEIDLDNIGNMTEKMLCPQATEHERLVLKLRSEQKVTEKTSNMFKCPNCGERMVTFVEVQLRALDEAPDYNCTCKNCGHKFRGVQ